MPRGFFGGLFDPHRHRDQRRAAKPVAIPVKKPVALRQPMTLGRSSAPTGKRTSVPVNHTGVEMFIAGTLAYVTSSWLKSAEFHFLEQTMDVTFLDGARVTVLDVTEDMARSFYAAPSKGGWFWTVVLGPNYKLGHPSTALMRWR